MRVETESRSVTDLSSDQESTVRMSQKFNLILDGLKNNKDVCIAKLIVSWLEYIMQTHIMSIDYSKDNEESKQSKGRQVVDLDKHLLGEDQLRKY